MLHPIARPLAVSIHLLYCLIDYKGCISDSESFFDTEFGAAALLILFAMAVESLHNLCSATGKTDRQCVLAPASLQRDAHGLGDLPAIVVRAMGEGVRTCDLLWSVARL